MTKKQTLIARIVLLLVFVLVLLRPQAGKLTANLATQKQLKAKFTKLEYKLAQLNGIDPVVTAERVQKMESVFPSTKPIVALLASLSRLAADHDLAFGGLSLSPGSLSQSSNKTSPLQDLRFGFQVGGDFDKISRFLISLENTAPLMKIESVALTIKTNPLFERSQTQVTAEITVAAYYQAPPESLGSLDKPLPLLNRSEETLLNRLLGFKTFPPIVPTAAVGKANLFEVQPVRP